MKNLKQKVAEWRFKKAKKKSLKALESWVQYIQAYRAVDAHNDEKIQETAQQIADYVMTASEIGVEKPEIFESIDEACSKLPGGHIKKEEVLPALRELIEVLEGLFNEATGMNLKISFEKK